MKTETVTSNEAFRLIFATLSAPDVQKERPSPKRTAALARTIGRWRQPPHISITDDGIVVQGIDALGALVATGKSGELEIERGVKAKRRGRATNAPLTDQLEDAGVDNAAPKLAVWRCLAEAFQLDQKIGMAQLAKQLRARAFTEAFEELSAVLETTATTGTRPTRVRSKIAFGAFFAAFHAAPKKVRDLYAQFLVGELDQSTPVGKLLHAVKTDNINTGSGRRPFLLKAAVLIDAQLQGESVERATSSEGAGSEALAKFQKAYDK